MHKEFEGIDGNVGAIAIWDSKNANVGKGEQEIINLIPNQRIEFALRFFEPWEMEATSFFEIESTGNNSTVTWGFDGESPWPWNISLLFTDMDAELGKDLDKGLKKLRKLQEGDEF